MSKGSDFPDITCPCGWDGIKDKMWDLKILPDIDFLAAAGASVFHNFFFIKLGKCDANLHYKEGESYIEVRSQRS